MRDKLKNIEIVQNIYIRLRKTLAWIRGGGLILLYHRVTEVSEDPHLMAVSPKNFETHMQYISEKYNPISLEEMTNRIKKGKSLRNRIAITFDDGYADNLYIALPILEKYKIPCTFFITTGPLQGKNTFHWDTQITENTRGRPMNIEELRKMILSPLVSIGAHTISHPSLSTLSKNKQEKEIQVSKKTLEDILHKKINSFAYPFGTRHDFNQTTQKLVKNNNFLLACANIRGYIYHNSPLYSLPRVNIRDLKIKEFKKSL